MEMQNKNYIPVPDLFGVGECLDVARPVVQIIYLVHRRPAKAEHAGSAVRLQRVILKGVVPDSQRRSLCNIENTYNRINNIIAIFKCIVCDGDIGYNIVGFFRLDMNVPDRFIGRIAVTAFSAVDIGGRKGAVIHYKVFKLR